jgi:prepilin-type N-terminal cleavage/methylation domain-containing protein
MRPIPRERLASAFRVSPMPPPASRSICAEYQGYHTATPVTKANTNFINGNSVTVPVMTGAGGAGGPAHEAPPTAGRTDLADEGGFSLIELLVAMAAGLVVVGVLLRSSTSRWGRRPACSAASTSRSGPAPRWRESRISCTRVVWATMPPRSKAPPVVRPPATAPTSPSSPGLARRHR